MAISIPSANPDLYSSDLKSFISAIISSLSFIQIFIASLIFIALPPYSKVFLYITFPLVLRKKYQYIETLLYLLLLVHLLPCQKFFFLRLVYLRYLYFLPCLLS